MRDFCKTPFILAAVLLMGCLLRNPMRARTYCAVSTLLGIVIGIGTGFRQDLLIFVFPAVLAVAAGAWKPGRVSLPVRGAALLLLLAAFVVSSWPVIRSVQQESNEQSPNQFMMDGFNMESVKTLGIGKSSYELLYIKHDFLMSATQQSFALRLNARANDKVVEVAGDPTEVDGARQWVVQAAKSFPADTLTRLCAAALWSLGRSVNEEPYQGSGYQKRIAPVAEHLASCGPFYAAFILLVMSARSTRLAWSVFLLTAFLCGYVGLLFEPRHAFYLCFVPFWNLAFLADKALKGVRRVLGRPFRQQITETVRSVRHGWGAPARRMLLFVCCASALIGVPFWCARFYQYFSVGAMLTRYHSAVLEPIPTRSTPQGDTILIEPERRLPSLDRPSKSPGMDVATEYCVAEFASTAGTFPMRLQYQPEPEEAEISGTVRVRAAGSGKDETTKYFFPVYEFTTPPASSEDLVPYSGKRVRFAGVAIPKTRAPDFKGFYRVKNINDFTLLLLLSLPDDDRFFRRYRRLNRGASLRVRLGSRYEQQGRFDKAAAAFRRAHECEPLDSDITTHLVHSIEMKARQHTQEGRPKEALAAYREALTLDPDDAAARKDLVDALFAMSQTLEQQGKWEEALAGYREVASMDEGHVPARVACANLYKKQGNVTDAAAAYREIIAINPSDSAAYDELDGLYAKEGDSEVRVALLRSVVQEHPDVHHGYVLLGRALEQQHDYQGAVDAYQKARQLAPGDAMIAGPLIQALAAQGRQSLEHGKLDTALAAFRQILSAEPGHTGAMLGMARAREGLRDRSEAIEMYCKAIGANPAQREAYDGLEALLLRAGQPDLHVAVWRLVSRALPRAAWAFFYLGFALESIEDYPAAFEAFSTARQLMPTDGNIARQLVQELTTQGNLLLERHQFGHALTAHRIARAIDAENINAKFGEARALEGLGKSSEAIEICRQAIAAAPTAQAPYGQMDDLLLRRNKPDGRVAVWRDLTRAFPQSVLAHIHLGNALDGIQDYEGEVEAYRTAYGLEPSNAVVEASLGVGLMRAYRYKEARERLQSALSRQPDLAPLYYEILISIMLAEKDYDAAWQCVDKCKAMGMPLSTPLLDALARDSKKLPP